MKKIVRPILIATLLLSFVSLPSTAKTNPVENTVPVTPTSAESNALVSRLEEIKAMDKSTMRAPEKRKLRQEVRQIKRNLANLNGGVYLSVGAIIIIVLLLILLL